MTSSDSSVATTGRPVGTCNSLAVVKVREGCASSYTISHHQLCDVILTLTARSSDKPASARSVMTLATVSPSKPMMETTNALVTTYWLNFCQPGVGSAGVVSLLRGARHKATVSAITISMPNTMQAHSKTCHKS